MKFNYLIKLMLVVIVTIFGNINISVAKNKVSKAALQAEIADFHIYVNSRKESGHPWHGPGDIFAFHGKIATNLPDAPGAVLCIITLNGEASCPGQALLGENAMSKKPTSPCPSSYDCGFDDIALPNDDVFGIVFIDPAYILINLIDSVILTRKPLTKNDPIIQDFDEKLRTAIGSLAPPGPFEKKRRTRQFQIRNLNDCSDGCKFAQSEIVIKPKR